MKIKPTSIIVNWRLQSKKAAKIHRKQLSMQHSTTPHYYVLINISYTLLYQYHSDRIENGMQ